MDSDGDHQPNFSEVELKLLEDFAFRINNEVSELREEVKQLRIDRQLRSFPSWLVKRIKKKIKSKISNRTKNRIKPYLNCLTKLLSNTNRGKTSKSSSVNRRQKNTILLVCHSYPVNIGDYGGLPIARRVPFYKEAGYNVSVFVPSNGRLNGTVIASDGTTVHYAPLSKIEQRAKRVKAGHLAVHSPTPEIFASSRKLMLDLSTHIWIHGFEARNWRELIFDFSHEEIARRGKVLDIMNVERQWALTELFTNPEINTIFVSEYMRSVAEDFARTKATRSQVIHNVIDPNLFPYSPKSEDMRMNICSIRNFGRRNYATDLMSRAIFDMSRKPWFSKLSIEIYGDGRHFEEDTDPLRLLENVKLHRGFVGGKDLRKIFARSGIALLPTRWDSQGMLNGEAMSSGVVPVSNAVTAIPEFISEAEGKLADPENSNQLAMGISELIENSEQFLTKSLSAKERVEAQCSPEKTVHREIELFEKSRL